MDANNETKEGNIEADATRARHPAWYQRYENPVVGGGLYYYTTSSSTQESTLCVVGIMGKKMMKRNLFSDKLTPLRRPVF